MDILRKIEQEHMRVDLPIFKAGDTIKVHVRIVEGEKTRIQAFEGIVLRIHRNGVSSSFAVRKVSSGVGVERIFSTHSPSIEKIEILSEGIVRQGRIFYLRQLKGKSARLKTKNKWLS